MTNKEHKTLSDVISKEEIIKWQPGDTVLISAGTGTGKSHFIKNSLYESAKAAGDKILMLIHRVNCVNQFNEEILTDGKTDVITIDTYQKIESDTKSGKGYDLSEYKYIVSDEFHYFVSDAKFNITTDISFDAIVNSQGIKIFMSATGDFMKDYLQEYISGNKLPQPYSYSLEKDYSYLQSLFFFYKEHTISELLRLAIEGKQKAIFFIHSAEKAYRLYKKYEKYCLFNCGEGSANKYPVDKEAVNRMLKNQKFDKQILITTTCMDAGVNIIDEDLHYIVCDIIDIGQLIQCIGRKRSQNPNDKLNLYVKAIQNRSLAGYERSAINAVEAADYLKEYGVLKFNEKYYRAINKNAIVYWQSNKITGYSKPTVNELMYHKSKCDSAIYRDMINTGKTGYCQYLANLLRFNWNGKRYTYALYEEGTLQNLLERYAVEKIVMLNKDARKELIESLNVRQDGILVQNIHALNHIIKEELDLQFEIETFITSRTVNGKRKRYENAWRVVKLS